VTNKLFDLVQKSTVAVESINFQDGKLFKELTESIVLLRKNVKQSDSDFFKSKEIKNLLKVIKDHTNLTIVLSAGEPSVFPPVLTGNHVFYDQEMMASLKYNWGIDTNEDVTKVLKGLKHKAISGEVDLVKAKVSGAYANMEMRMMMPVNMLANEKPYLAEEVAAIMLHEIGHVFTFMEFVSRASTTNQSLSLLSRMLDSSISQDTRVTVFAKSAKELELSKEKEAALLRCKTEEQLTVILIDAGIEKSVSELGRSIYDVNSCEYLADQFATRMGAGRYLVTGLDKLMNSTFYKVIGFVNMALFLTTIIGTVVATNVTAIPLFLLILIAGVDKKVEIYDNMAARINRVKLQNVEQLKDKSLPKEVREHLLQEIETIDKVALGYKDKLPIIDKLAYYIRPGYRNAHKYEMLQKELENMASNSLFTAAAKLKTI